LNWLEKNNLLEKSLREKKRNFQLKGLKSFTKNKEVWCFHKNIECYVVSNKGRIKSLLTQKILKEHSTPQGYKQIGLYIRSKRKSFMVHRLVAETYIPIKNSNYYEVNHIDGNKNNNAIENLEWCTRQENLEHAHKMKLFKRQLGETNGRCKIKNIELLDIKELFKLGFKAKDIANAYNIGYTQVYRILKGERK
jgi:HNH endonuclease/NUMOD4 motif-containing protein